MVAGLAVRRRDGRASVYATRRFAAGERVLAVRGEERPAPSRYTIQVGNDRHLHPVDDRAVWRFLNHSCAPNLRLDPDSRCFVACTTLAPGEELTYDYLTTEWEMAAPFACECGASWCRGPIAGFRHLDDAAKASLRDHVLPHVRDLEGRRAPVAMTPGA